MNKQKNEGYMDTVSSADMDVRVIRSLDMQNTAFDYKFFCANVIKMSKRKTDACFLVPLRLYHRESGIRDDKIFLELEKWMDAFTHNGNESIFFWVYLDYLQGYSQLKNCGDDIKHRIGKNVEADVRTVMNDISKTEKANYIKLLCEKRGDEEYWILRAYELTIKYLFSAGELTVVIKNVINYLKSCDIKIDMPPNGNMNEGESRYVYQIMANLMLLITRLRFGISEDVGIQWYYDGNQAYFNYRDWMLEEYMRIVGQYSYQSYERFVRMNKIVEEGKNKYAAKELGDIYRLGMILKDGQNNTINIAENQNIACKYYRISMENKYIPAYIAAIKTGMLTNEKQKEEILVASQKERNLESLSYCADKSLDEMDKHVRKNVNKSLEYLKTAVETILFMEDFYEKKHVLKNKLLLSETCKMCRRKEIEVSSEITELLKNLYGVDILRLDENKFLEMIEKNYLSAGDMGYYEAEYQLGKMFLERDNEKSRSYFAMGEEKGCEWCKLECARQRRERDPGEWLKTLVDMGKRNRSLPLQMEIAKELSAFDQCSAQPVEEMNMTEECLMELYIQIEHSYSLMVENLNSVLEKDRRKKETGELNRLLEFQDQVIKAIGVLLAQKQTGDEEA